jgi:hypothetical protein
MATGNLWNDALARVPVDALRGAYSAQYVSREFRHPNHTPGWEEDDRKMLVQVSDSMSRGTAHTHLDWVVGYWTWLFDECGLSIHMVVTTLFWPAEATAQEIMADRDRYRYQLTPLDFVCVAHRMVGAEQLLSFCLDRGGHSCRSLDWLLMLMLRGYFRNPDAHVRRMAERLIREGAGLSELGEGNHEWYRYYKARQESRAACVILLRMHRLRPDLRKYVPEGVWRMVATRVWWFHFVREE